MKSIFNHHYIFVHNNIIQFSPIIFPLKISILNSKEIKESRNIYIWNKNSFIKNELKFFFILTNAIAEHRTLWR